MNQNTYNGKPKIDRVKKFTKRDKLELMKYKNIFPNEKKFEAIYKIVNSIVDSKSSRKLSVQEVSQKTGYPAHKINYWLDRYKEKGITYLIDYEQVVIQFLKQCGKPINEWNKGSLHEYVNRNGIVIKKEKIKISRSETFYFNILKKMKGWPDTDFTDIINKTYKHRQVNNCQTIYIDYVIIPGNPGKLIRPTYYYIIINNRELLLKEVKIHNGNMKYKNMDVEVFNKIMEYLSDSSYEQIMVVLKDNEINRVIAEVYSKACKKVLVTIGRSTNLQEGLQQGLRYLSDIKNKLENEPAKLENAKSRNAFIEKNRRKYEEVKII